MVRKRLSEEMTLIQTRTYNDKKQEAKPRSGDSDNSKLLLGWEQAWLPERQKGEGER